MNICSYVKIANKEKLILIYFISTESSEITYVIG